MTGDKHENPHPADDPANPPELNEVVSENDAPGSPHFDEDSAYGESDFASETASLTSSILKYREENGRTYHAYGSTEYWGPNDEKAQEQLDFSHHFWTLMLDDKFFLAPVENPHRILDLGTGTGIWVMDVADRYPGSHVKGIDLSPIQPWWTAPNALFEVDDFNLPNWDLNTSYDLIHLRELLGGVLDWPNLLRKCFEGLSPGGWIECAEPDIRVLSNHVVLPENDPNRQYVEAFREVSAKTGMTFEPAVKLKTWLKEAGFVNVTERVLQVPVGVWPQDSKQKTLGLWNQVRLANGMQDFCQRMLKNIMGWSDAQIDSLVERSKAAVQNSKLCTHQDIYIVYGQRPRA